MAEQQHTEATKQPDRARTDRAADLAGPRLDLHLQRVSASFQGSRLDPHTLTPHAILALQRTVGNAAVNRLLQQVVQRKSSGQESRVAIQRQLQRHDSLGGVYYADTRAPDVMFTRLDDETGALDGRYKDDDGTIMRYVAQTRQYVIEASGAYWDPVTQKTFTTQDGQTYTTTASSQAYTYELATWAYTPKTSTLPQLPSWFTDIPVPPMSQPTSMPFLMLQPTAQWALVDCKVGKITHNKGAEYQEIIGWVLPSHLQNGFVVQHVMLIDNGTIIDEYYEAWRIVSGKEESGDDYATDQFTFGPMPPNGSGMIIGNAYMTTSNEPANWPTGTIKRAAGLRASRAAPKGWPSQGGFTRTITWQTGGGGRYRIMRNGIPVHNNLLPQEQAPAHQAQHAPQQAPLEPNSAAAADLLHLLEQSNAQPGDDAILVACTKVFGSKDVAQEVLGERPYKVNELVALLRHLAGSK